MAEQTQLKVVVPKKYGDMKTYRVDLVMVINNESDPAFGLPTQFMLVRRRKNGKFEALVAIDGTNA